MCGIAGEVRFDGHDADVAAVARINEAMHRRGPDGTGVHATGRAAFGHRRLKILDLSECGAQPMVDNELGLTTVFNGLIYNYRELARGAGGPRLPLLLHHRHRGAAQGLPPVGPGVRRALPRHVRLRRRSSATPACSPSAATGSASSRSTTPRRRPAAVRLARCRRCWTGGEVDTSIDKVALHHYMSFHSVVPAPRTILNGRAQAAPRDRPHRAAGRHVSADHVYWRPEHVRRPEYAGMSSADWRDAVLEALRLAVKRRMVADVPVGVLLSGGLDSSLVVAPARARRARSG